MSEKVTFKIDGKEYQAEAGQTIYDAAKDNGVYIPTLCHYEGTKPVGSCRMCTVNVNNRPLTSCTTPVADGMEIENDTAELVDFRKSIVELLFIEGNHFCPACEKSGNCELQAMAYRFRIPAPRFPFQFTQKSVDAQHPHIMQDKNRCIACKRCIRLVTDDKGRKAFEFNDRGHDLHVAMDKQICANMTEEMAEYAMEICPVGSLLKKEKGFAVPVGDRKFDNEPIGSHVEQEKSLSHV